MRYLTVGAAALLWCIPLSAWGAEGPSADSAPDQVDVRIVGGSDLRVSELLRAGGRMVPVMMVFSVGTVAFAIYCGIACRRRSVVPGLCHKEVMSLAPSGDRAGVLRAVEKSRSLYARAVRAALEAGSGEMRTAALASGQRDAAILQGTIGIVPGLAALAALLGMLGTTVGMLQAFAASAHAEFHYALVHAGVMKALTLSFMGYAIAAIAIACHFALRTRLDRALADAAFSIEEFVRAYRSS